MTDDNNGNAPGPGHGLLLVVGPGAQADAAAELEAMADADGRPRAASGPFDIKLPEVGRIRVWLTADPEAALDLATREPVRGVLVDNRERPYPRIFSDTVAGRALPLILAGAPSGRVPARSRIFSIIPGGKSAPHHAYAAGTLQLGGVLVAPTSLEGPLTAVARAASPAKPGKVALCLAGGGIEGMIYEIGVLRALDEALGGGGVADFDLFSGISAGAVLAAFLANGIRPGEIADAIHGRNSRVDPITRGMLFDPNIAEITTRAAGALKDVVRGEWLAQPLASAMRVTPTSLFSGDKLRWYLEKELTRPGLTNDFNQLEKELYIGTTDQDAGVHVTFGEEGQRDVPISHAVRASCAMTPYYNPERLKGRYFVDGIFTRTINLDVAVACGARLIICIDPLTPVQVDEPGYVSSQGGFFNTVQSVKSMIRTRLSELIGRAEEAYPDVSVYVFSPTPQDLEQMSGTLMRFFYRTETEEMAYSSASARIAADRDWLGADLARHGFGLK